MDQDIVRYREVKKKGNKSFILLALSLVWYLRELVVSVFVCNWCIKCSEKQTDDDIFVGGVECKSWVIIIII